jgi:uncharacterized cupredoxin-like copper-binding protein
MTGSHRMRRLLSPVAIILITAALPAVAAENGKQATPVTVIASDYHFTPDNLALKQGVTYRLRIENRGKELHEFNAPGFFQSVELGDPAALNPDRTEIAVPPGETKELVVTPKKPGNYRLICPDHDWAGMTGKITVE